MKIKRLIFEFFILVMSCTSYAQTTQVNIENIAKDPMLAQWLTMIFEPNLQTERDLAVLYDKLKNQEKKPPKHLSAACLKEKDEWLIGSTLKSALILIDDAPINEKTKIYPLVKFLHTDDGMKFIHYNHELMVVYGKINLEIVKPMLEGVELIYGPRGLSMAQLVKLNEKGTWVSEGQSKVDNAMIKQLQIRKDTILNDVEVLIRQQKNGDEIAEGVSKFQDFFLVRLEKANKTLDEKIPDCVFMEPKD